MDKKKHLRSLHALYWYIHTYIHMFPVRQKIHLSFHSFIEGKFTQAPYILFGWCVCCLPLYVLTNSSYQTTIATVRCRYFPYRKFNVEFSNETTGGVKTTIQHSRCFSVSFEIWSIVFIYLFLTLCSFPMNSSKKNALWKCYFCAALMVCVWLTIATAISFYFRVSFVW